MSIDTKSTLIVDDEMDICLLLKNFFKKKSSSVEYCLTLEDGIKKSETMKPTLIILDNNLPDGFGINNIAKFKMLDESVRVIVISAMSNLEEQALKHGADYFIAKPISFTHLDEILSK